MSDEYIAFKQNTQFNDGVTPWMIRFCVKQYRPEMLVAIRSVMNRAAIKSDVNEAYVYTRRMFEALGIDVYKMDIIGYG